MIIIHRCSCGHPDIFHSASGNTCQACPASVHELGTPELIPTFVDGQVNEYVHKPGSKTSGFMVCDCADCQALYAEVKTSAKPLRPWYSREAS